MRKRLRLPTLEEIEEKGIEAVSEHLTTPQLYALLKQYTLAKKDSRPLGTLPRNPSDFAIKYSKGRWVSAPHLEEISKRLVTTASSGGRLMVSMPPRHGKSLLIDIWFPLYLLSWNPQCQIILCSYEADFAAEWGMQVRDKVRELGEVLNLQLDERIASRDNWKLTTGGGMRTAGAGGPITGKGANVLIIDDPVKNEEEASSKIMRDKMYNWWQTTALTRIEPNGCCILVGTRWHQDDLLGRLEAESDSGEGLSWDILKLPAEAEKIDALNREPGEWLWPARFTPQKYEEMKKGMSPFAWSALYQQRPTPESGGGIDRRWWKYYTPDDLPDSFDQVIQSWDLALTDKQSSDFNVGQVWGRRGADFYLLAQFRERCDIIRVIHQIKTFQKRYPKAVAKLVEESASGPALIQSLRHSVPGLIPIPAKSLGKGTIRKEVLLKAVAPAIEAGGAYLPRNFDGTFPFWVKEYIEEFAQFPKGVNDDQVDCTTQALNYMLPGGWHSAAKSHKEALEVNEARDPVNMVQKRFWKQVKTLKELSAERENQREDIRDLLVPDDWSGYC